MRDWLNFRRLSADRRMFDPPTSNLTPCSGSLDSFKLCLCQWNSAIDAFLSEILELMTWKELVQVPQCQAFCSQPFSSSLLFFLLCFVNGGRFPALPFSPGVWCTDQLAHSQTEASDSPILYFLLDSETLMPFCCRRFFLFSLCLFPSQVVWSLRVCLCEHETRADAESSSRFSLCWFAVVVTTWEKNMIRVSVIYYIRLPIISITVMKKIVITSRNSEQKVSQCC